ncbi:hypothetical protein HBB16_16785 [Pseudonocardia sp. MCCB 268]|nr:hypothetical protein [Pseudonocardia cytotoxica]
MFVGNDLPSEGYTVGESGLENAMAWHWRCRAPRRSRQAVPHRTGLTT